MTSRARSRVVRLSTKQRASDPPRYYGATTGPFIISPGDHSLENIGIVSRIDDRTAAVVQGCALFYQLADQDE